jgi:3-phosphoshikimate 1-carboxyvinyltransferase
MPEIVAIKPVDHPVVGTISPPGSKSLTNRALICAALADGRSTLMGALDSDDTRVMIDSLIRLGLEVTTADSGNIITVVGSGGRFHGDNIDLFVGNSGTTIRFLTAMLSVGHGRFRLDGVSRMRERPIGDLIDALNQLGVRTYSELDNGCPPVVVDASGLAGGTARIAGAISSQYLSGLLMAAPLASSAVRLLVEGTLVSQTYVAMTLEVMRRFGIEIVTDDQFTTFELPGSQTYRACEVNIEPDASAASYFWAAAAVTQGRVTVHGLSAASLQGDVAFVDCLEHMGCVVLRETNAITVEGPKHLRGIDVDMNTISDTAQTLAAVALFANSPTTIRGVGHNRHKETDRIGNLAIELRKLGAEVDEFDDGFTVIPGPPRAARIVTYDDHRMAMSLALAGLRISGTEIEDPACTAKTYPNFWTDLDRLVHNSTGQVSSAS